MNMGFSTEWETVYRKNRHMSVWPWTDLVSYVHRYTDVPKKQHVKVLELGCGAGANIGFFASLGADYYGIDGSETIIDFDRERYPQYADNLIVHDFTESIPFDVTFDLICDRGALTHNTTDGIKKTIDAARKKLAKDGKYMGISWFSTKYEDYSLGTSVPNDPFTRYFSESDEGYFGGLGNVHFSDEAHLRELFRNFEFVIMEERVTTTVFPMSHQYADWNFIVRK